MEQLLMFKMKFLLFVVASNIFGLGGSRVELDSQCLNCFNVDYDKTIWLEQEPSLDNPEPENDLFGFSLALGDKKVYIGAPGFGKTGNVFQCPVSFDKSKSSSNSGSSLKAPCYDTELNTAFKNRGKSRFLIGKSNCFLSKLQKV